jgi:hypothetical protein
MNRREDRGVARALRAAGGLAPLLALLAACPRGKPAAPPSPGEPAPPRAIAALWALSDGDDVERESTVAPGPSTVWDGRQVNLFAARNEIVAFQVMVRAGAPGIRALEAQLPALDSTEGRRSIQYRRPPADPSDFRGRDIAVFAVGYMKVERPTFCDFIYAPGGPDAPADPTGWKAVQLVPENARPGRGGFPVAVRPGENQALWFEIYVGRDHPPGRYRGSIQVTADGERVQVPVELEVLDFALPDEPALTAMVYYESEQPALYQGRNLDAAYHRFAHRQRIELVHGYDLPAVQAALGRFDGRDFTPAAGYAGPGEGIGNRIVAASFYGPGDAFADGRRAWPRADAWMSFLAEKLPRAITFLYLPDEPAPETFPQIKALVRDLRANPGPGRRLPTLATHEFDARLAGAIDIWVAGTKFFDPRKAAAERAAGRQYWFYNGGRPYGPAFTIDAPASDPRVIGWQAFKADTPVYFYWHAVHWRHNSQKKVGERNQNVWASPVTFDLRDAGGKGEWANGEGVLIYPGTEVLHPAEDRGIAGPIGTVQLANLRRGLQDHLYLTLARARGQGALVDELVAKIVPRVFAEGEGAVSFPQEPGPFEEARRRLGRAIAGAKPARAAPAAAKPAAAP